MPVASSPSRVSSQGGVQSDTQAVVGSRVILLGASNLTRALPTVVHAARRCCPGPSDFLIACGHGRSYGGYSRVCGRTLPGILESGLWESEHWLRGRRESSPPPTFAMLTDIGNDLLYGHSPQTIASWLAQCGDRLEEHGSTVVITSLPTANVQKLSPLAFVICRTMLFPRNRTDHATLLALVDELDQRVRELGAKRNWAIAEHDTDWYGFDPIHIRRRHHARAYEGFFSQWETQTPGASLDSQRPHKAVGKLKPQRYWRWGREKHVTQPAMNLSDGGTISLF